MLIKVLEIVMAVNAIVGAFLVASNDISLQVTGFTLWIVANICGIIFFVKSVRHHIPVDYKYRNFGIFLFKHFRIF